jgi:hypothetical protein
MGKSHLPLKTFVASMRCVFMFGLFKKKTALQKLQEQHAQLLKESFVLSKTNRKAADLKAAEADALAQKIAAMQSE